MSFSINGSAWYNTSSNTATFTQELSCNVASSSSGYFLLQSTSNSIYLGADEGLKLLPEGVDACWDGWIPCVAAKSSGYSSGRMMSFFVNGTEEGYINYTGSAIAYNKSSDYRIKDNINPLPSQWDNIKSLKPVNFTMKMDPSSTPQSGFIAHELAEVYSDLVDKDKDAVDQYGLPDYQMIDYSELTTHLVKALQEAMERVEVLKDKLAEKVKRIEALENE
jgi:hypothetical protein